MSWIYPVVGFWIALLLGFTAYFTRRKKLGGRLRIGSGAVALLALLLLLYWGFRH